MIKLWPHQIEALQLSEGKNRVGYFYDMGLGKTIIGSEKMAELGCDTNIVICQKSKIQDWMDNFTKDFGYTEVYDLTDKKQYNHFFQNIGRYSMIGIINYELAWRRPQIKQLQDFTLMLDESQLIQNEKSKRAKFILGLNPLNVILLSGTPNDGHYERLYSQCKLLGYDISKKLFFQQYIITEKKKIFSTGMWITNVVGYKNVERLKRKLAEHGALFMTTEEVIDLPDQIDSWVKIPKSDAYEQFMQDSYIEEDENHKELVGDTSLTKRLYARQLCGMYSPDKLEAFEDLINSSNDRFVVFYNFDAELDAMEKIALTRTTHLSYVRGGQNDIENFRKYDDAILFCQYQAASRGGNYQEANKMILFSPPESYEMYSQCRKRIHRIGQTKPCFYYLMKCTDSVEEQIYEALAERKDYTDALFKKQNS